MFCIEINFDTELRLKEKSRLKADDTNVESHYIPKKNETWIMERSNDLRDDTFGDEREGRPIVKKLPGMVVPYMETERGRVNVKY